MSKLFVDEIQPKTTGGIITSNPNRPSFLAHRYTSGLQSLATQTNEIVEFNETDYNTGGHYNASNYTFTCPVSGLYHFDHWLYVYTTSQTNTRLYINGVSKYRFASIGVPSAQNPHGAGGGISIKLNSNDTVKLYVWSASANANIYAGATGERASFFSGYLIG